MKKKKIAHCIPHTHWDLLWYFSHQDAMVTFSYNMKEMLRAFESGEIRHFFLDGQTYALDEYLQMHPEDLDKVKKLVSDQKLVVGPFNSQLDCFISSGESIINNLRLGIRSGNALGGSSKIAYLSDPFGQNYDFPKIFNQMGIHDFVFTRGVGDEYGLGIDFYFKSNDGSKVLAHTLLSGYGYGAYAFKEGTLFTKDAEDYNKIDVQLLVDRLLDRTVLENEFVFPLGFDQNPIMLDIDGKIEKYNNKFDDYHFELTTWKDYLKRVREYGKDIKTFEGELVSAQFHRIHKSGMNSARSDIKYLQDEVERILTYETQPIMTMLDSLGIPYDQSILDKAWTKLSGTQAHTSATLTDESNAAVKSMVIEALNIAIAGKLYLMHLTSLSLDSKEKQPLVVFNPLPYPRDIVFKLKVLTKNKNFDLMLQGSKLDYTIIESKKEYAGVVKKDPKLMIEDKYFYRTTITVKIDGFKGISYKTIYINESTGENSYPTIINNNQKIENNRYKIELLKEGIMITDKKLNKVFNKAIYIEDGADEGDNYDYSYPDKGKDLILYHYLENAECKAFESDLYSVMEISGSMDIPETLKDRENKNRNSSLKYKLKLKIKGDSDIIEIKGTFNNQAKDHRVRIVFASEFSNEYSYGGTQFGYIKRETNPEVLKTWKENNWFEEPSSTNPLLNHVSAVGKDYTLSVFTRSLKEYDFINDGYKDIALTVYRSCGYLGLPDLNRRPGRPSGLANKVFETPNSQMVGDVNFEIGIAYYQDFDANMVMRDYTKYATNQMYWQNQTYDKTIFPICYFPMNPWITKLPDQYNFIELNDSEACFGTLVKAYDKGYVLRIFNSENHEVPSGNLEIGCEYQNIYKTDLLEENSTKLGNDLGNLKTGELRNILIK